MDDLREAVRAQFVPCSLLVLGRERHAGEFSHHHSGRIALHTLAYGTEVRLVVDTPPEHYIVHVPLSGTRAGTVDGIDALAEGCVAGPGQHLDVSWSGDASTLVVSIPRGVVDAALAARLGEAPATALRFEPALRAGTKPISEWTELTRRFVQFVASPLAVRSALAVDHFEQLLIHGLIDAQPHALTDQLTTGGMAVAPKALRRALAYCEEHADQPITLADIANAARTSPRSLQQAFRVHLNTTPLTHLRQIRLERAHQQLQSIAKGNATGTITDVALRCGFTHLGRFSSRYRQTYGHPPSQTLDARPADQEPRH